MTTLSNTLQLTEQLISRQSVTPEDNGCQPLMIERLEAIGFKIEHLRFADVDNFWAVHGTEGPIFCFAGHTDVVPTGPAEQWQHPPTTDRRRLESANASEYTSANRQVP